MEADKRELIARITDCLAKGGLFNMEVMEAGKVRDLLIDCRSELEAALAATPTPPIAGWQYEHKPKCRQGTQCSCGLSKLLAKLNREYKCTVLSSAAAPTPILSKSVEKRLKAQAGPTEQAVGAQRTIVEGVLQRLFCKQISSKVSYERAVTEWTDEFMKVLVAAPLEQKRGEP